MVTTVTLAADLHDVTQPGVLWWSGARIIARDSRLDARLAAAEAGVRQTPPADAAAVRTMYKRVGLDPTKTRPSNEALLRRAIKGQPFPRVNTLVDVINWCSLEFQLPYGVYDRARLRGDVTLRRGRPGEAYAGIRKDTVNVAGRLALVDEIGPFGNPTSDSARSMVTEETTDALVVVYAPVDVDRRRLAHVLDTTAARMADIVGGHEAGRLICP